MENEYDNNKVKIKRQLSSKENKKLVLVKTELDCIRHINTKLTMQYTPIANLAHAYGMSDFKVRDCVTVYLWNNCMKQQIQRCDTGLKREEAKKW